MEPLAKRGVERGGRPSLWPIGLFLAVNAAGWIAAVAVRRLTPLQMKFMHLPVFFLWTLSLAILCRRTLLWRPRIAAEAGIACLAAVAAELIQAWIPGHVCEWRGLTASLVGVALAAAILAAADGIRWTGAPQGSGKTGATGAQSAR
ncbi:MAG: hypothetical protein N3A38_01350 [Planctomycetota bacterium]|nr:hypothetical protein [Planctomycetota bacterium]